MTARVALVGLGWAARSIWLPRLCEHPGYEVTAAVDPDPVARAETSAVLPGVRTWAAVGDLPAGAVDLAVVAVPNHLHAKVSCQLLENGIPVFVEKPVCLSSAEADQLAAAERAGGAVLLAGSAARYRADVRALVALARSLGRIRHLDLAWVRSRGVPDAGGWFTQRRLAGGGALIDLGWHLLDAAAPLLGPAAIDQVVGTTSADFVNDRSRRAAWREDEAVEDFGSGGDVEDTVRGFLVTSDATSVALRASWASHEPRDVTVLTADGSAGSATLRCTFGFSPNREPSTLTRTRDGRTEPVPVPVEPVGAEYRRQLDQLPALLADPASSGRAITEAAATVRVIEGLYDSARRARAIAWEAV